VAQDDEGLCAKSVEERKIEARRMIANGVPRATSHRKDGITNVGEKVRLREPISKQNKG
jgi:hypothetical protein